MEPVAPPRLNTIDLSTAMDRTNYWREGVKGLYNNNMDAVPHGFFIHIEDILELAQLHYYYGSRGTQIVGVRAYLTLHHPQLDGPPYTDAITALLVPVERVPVPIPPSMDVLAFVEKDMIIPAPKEDGTEGSDGDNVTIYDVTMPCPKICDASSPLY